MVLGIFETAHWRLTDTFPYQQELSLIFGVGPCLNLRPLRGSSVDRAPTVVGIAGSRLRKHDQQVSPVLMNAHIDAT